MRIRVYSARRETAKGARKMQEVVAFAEVAAPVLKGDDWVRIFVEDLLRVVLNVRAPLNRTCVACSDVRRVESGRHVARPWRVWVVPFG